MKRTKTKLMALVMALAVMLTLYSVQAFAASEEYEIDGAVGGMIEFDAQTGTITGLSDDVTSLVIPETIDGVTVTAIADQAFLLCKKLTSVYIPATVTSIGSEVFARCANLVSIEVDENNTILSSVDGVLFSKDGQELIKYPTSKAGTSYTVDENVKIIGDYAFDSSLYLEEIVLPQDLAQISVGSFSGCYALKTITLPAGITEIPNEAFYNAMELETFEFLGEITSIGDDAFRYCYALESITIPQTVELIGERAFYECSSLTSLEIPQGVTSIGGGAFLYCSKLSEITIPASVSVIGEYAFYICLSLETVYYGSTKEDFEKIDIAQNNDYLLNANIIYDGEELLKVDVLENFTNTATQIRVNWNSLEGASGYRVYINVDGEWVKLITLYGEDTITYRVEDLLPETDYEFAVKAFFKSDEPTVWTSYSDAISACTEPLEVEVLSNFTATYDAIRVNWEETRFASGYRVYMNVDGKWVKLVTLYGSDTTTYRVADLLLQTDYEFAVKAFYKSDEPTVWSDYSEAINAYTDTLDVEVSSSFTATVDAIRINWEETNGVAGYRVYAVVDGVYEKVVTLYGDDTTTYRMSGFVPDTNYDFVVRSFYKTDTTTYWGDYSSKIKAYTDAIDVTSKTEFSAGENSLTFNWETLDDVSGYRVYLINSSGAYVNNGTYYGDSKSSVTINGLHNGYVYKFAVRAFYKTDTTTYWGEYSEVVYAMTKMQAPEITSYAREATSVTVNWDTVTGATGYKVYYNDGSGWKTGASIYSGTTKTAKVTGLKENTTYQFKVVAFSKTISPTQWGSQSDTFEVRTVFSKLTTPKDLTVSYSSLTSSSVKLTWNAVDCSGYIIFYYDGSEWYPLDYIYNASTNSYTVTGLKSNTRYIFAVSSYNATTTDMVMCDSNNFVYITTK
ncbi:MAG: fibronectin type III domain-containing protein [Clostridia bacterium]